MDHPLETPFQRLWLSAGAGRHLGLVSEGNRSPGAKRSDFADAVHFVGWYHYQSHVRNGIPLNDAYHLYLAYYAGHGGYSRGVWKNKPYMQRSARRAAAMADQYRAQMARCGR